MKMVRNKRQQLEQWIDDFYSYTIDDDGTITFTDHRLNKGNGFNSSTVDTKYGPNLSDEAKAILIEPDTSSEELDIKIDSETFLDMLYQSSDLEISSYGNYSNSAVEGLLWSNALSYTSIAGAGYGNGFADALVKLLAYNKTKITPELEHKLIWLNPKCAESIGLENITYEGKVLYIKRNPSGILKFENSTAELQVMAVRSYWKYILNIKNVTKEALAVAAEGAIKECQETDERRTKYKDALTNYDKDELTKIRDFFADKDFDEVVKNELIGTIDGIFLKFEMMNSFIDKSDFEDKK